MSHGMVAWVQPGSLAEVPSEGPLFVTSNPMPPMKKYPQLPVTDKEMPELPGLVFEAPTCLSNLVSHYLISFQVPHQATNPLPPLMPCFENTRGTHLSDKLDHRHRRKVATEFIPHPGIILPFELHSAGLKDYLLEAMTKRVAMAVYRLRGFSDMAPSPSYATS